jgi:uncharacterized protein
VSITPEAGRVLGCLVEKQLTTPLQYPLTLNALTLACNQATNREPVMALAEERVQQALQELKELHLVRFVLPSHGKSVTRYRHVLDEAYGLDPARMALLAMLLLRGPQTLGELRGRTERMAGFESLTAVQNEIEVLAGQPEPLVRLQPRQPGQKEERWQQLLATEPSGSPVPVSPSSHELIDAGSTVDAVPNRADAGIRIDALESEVADLRDQIGELSDSLAALRRSLGE